MSRLNAQQQSRSMIPVHGTTNTHLSGSQLVTARIVWLLLVIPSLSLFVVGLPVYFVQLQRPCADAVTCNIPFALTARGLRAIAVLGFSAFGYAAFTTLFWTLIFIIWSGIGLLIFFRKSNDRMALLTAFFLVMFNMGTSTIALPLAYPVLALPVIFISLLGQVALGLFFLLFPNGRLVPRWMGVIIPLIIIRAVAYVAPSTSPFSMTMFPEWLNGLIALLIYGSIIVSHGRKPGNLTYCHWYCRRALSTFAYPAATKHQPTPLWLER